MDRTRFATLVDSLASSRRRALGVLGSLGLGPIIRPFATAARKRKRKRKACARAGQPTGKRRKKCCGGLRKDAAGRCNPIDACASCAGNAICVAGTCQPCTVTCPPGATDCAAALETSMAAGGTVYVCPGLYAGNLSVTRSVTVIGAGQGADPTRDTILQGTSSSRVVRIAGTAVTTVNLRQLRITGGNGGVYVESGHIASLVACTVTGNTTTDSGGFGAGIIAPTGSRLSLAGCTISGNMASNSGGGIWNYGGRVSITDSVMTGNVTSYTGGGIHTEGGVLTLDAASQVMGNRSRVELPDSGGGIHSDDTAVTLGSSANVTGNTPDNCGGDAIALCVD